MHGVDIHDRGFLLPLYAQTWSSTPTVVQESCLSDCHNRVVDQHSGASAVKLFQEDTILPLPTCLFFHSLIVLFLDTPGEVLRHMWLNMFL